jgi:chromosome segregation ATPase
MPKRPARGKPTKPAKKPVRKAAPKAAKKPLPKKPARKAARAAGKPAARRPPAAAPSVPGDEALREELAAARQELARLALEENVVKRNLEAQFSDEKSANERLRAELEAVRLDLKTALADLEIARSDKQRSDSKALAAARDLVAAHEAQRRAEHAGDEARAKLYALESDNEKLRGELESVQRQLATRVTPSQAGGAS